MRSIISILFGVISAVLVLSSCGCNAFTTVSKHTHNSNFHPPSLTRHTTTINDIRSSTNLQMARNDIEGTDRILACLPYIIPLLE